MTIKQKVIASTAIFIATVLMLGLTVLYGYRHVTIKASLANDFEKESMYMQMMLRGLNEVILKQGSGDSIKTAKNGFNGFKAIYRKVLIEEKDTELIEFIIKDIGPHWHIILANINPFLENYTKIGHEESLMRADTLIAESDLIIKHVRDLAEKTRDVVNKTSETSAFIEKTMVLTGIIMLLLSISLAYHLYASITRPIKELTTIAEGFNRGELNIMMDESRKDEFGVLAEHFNKSTTKLNRTTLTLQERTKELTESNVHLQAVIEDRKLVEETISHMAYHDSLTNLPNRDLFRDRLNMYILQVQRYKKKGAVLFIDIDDFKRINDTLGHTPGDILLKEVAEKLSACIRSVDTLSRQSLYDDLTSTVARLGGDEFTILLTELQNSEDAIKVGQRLMASVANPFQLNGNEIFITLSIGIALCPEDGEDADILLKNADTAMYHAKSRGKNNLQFYKETMNAVYLKRLTMESDLRKAIENNEMLMHYQPRVDARTGIIISSEALVRWEKPGCGLVPPNEFIALAEETGLIIPLGEWILKTACKQNMEWQAAGCRPLCVSVNISGRQMQKDNFMSSVFNALNNSSLDPRYLELELTESVLMKNAESTIEMLYKLKNIGVRLSMDDFGTGYSSFSYLKRFPLDVIKIDKSFIDDIPDKADTAAIVVAIISMAHSLNLKVVAEGVELSQQLAFLSDNGCDEVQGYYFSRPLPAEEFASLINKSRHQTLIR